MHFFKICKKILKLILPPLLVNFYRYINNKEYVYFSGTYRDWQSAKDKSDGYGNPDILKKVLEATKLVVSGKANYEQDGQVFYKNSYSYELISVLLKAALENKNRLCVLDFGGALGSTYFSNREFLEDIENLKWFIVEQNNYVELGKSNFANNIISFHDSIEEALKQNHPNVILFSGVLQYLPEPYVVLKKAINSKADYIIIDRNPFICKGDIILTIQKVPPHLIKSSYPVWLFNEIDFKSFFLNQYAEVETFSALDGIIGQGSLKTKFKGIVYKRIK